MQAVREKLLAVPRPIDGIHSPVEGLAFMSCNLTATQPKTYLGRASEAPVEAYIKEEFEGRRHSLPHRGHQAAEVVPVLDQGFEDGAVHGN